MKEVIEACKITDKILKKTIKNIKSFKTELDIENFLKKETKENNCKLAFPPVVATGANAAEIHHKPNKTKIKKGFLVIDFGVKYKGYCSDCTRTVYIGKPKKYEIELYNLVLLAQKIALDHVQPGVPAADIDLIARAILKDHYIKFVHSTGHGVGKRIHQAPYLSPRSKSILRENQIITIEPGLYFKNKLGIRIEDTVIVKNKPIILTKTIKKMVVI